MENVREAKRAKPGPKPSAVLDYFEEVGDYSSSSKRYARKCKFCLTTFPAHRAKVESLIAHIASQCKCIPPAVCADFCSRHAAEVAAKTAEAARDSIPAEQLSTSSTAAASSQGGTASATRGTSRSAEAFCGPSAADARRTAIEGPFG
ncbi:hypothetical protein VOLCADRAFT_89321 [Volvox carteri f. nagariensis]|uniref:Uncharacterized protein n=1 Tax=Volvox carteri f. nagariensis TaxID=3068 RepID=D8TRE4_VOLCA|nr:uncharacterized protein VOLCADRAFT_89321 [Volvox carteri f. nagariensis]EFJ49882.1 hypothetical protein VOLCADRAFT_89321 [Volvox carteri f. nagariensis]|eukprot:XP_002948947.1 hypothetical protein VOLCADRAFT_89321 [Volvox carteri f. nagariensis]